MVSLSLIKDTSLTYCCVLAWINANLLQLQWQLHSLCPSMIVQIALMQIYIATSWGVYIIWLSPDQISYLLSMHRLGKFMHDLKEPHWQAVKRILCYLKQTISFGFFIPKSQSLHFQASVDSDWDGDPDDRQSVGAYCIYLGASLISWTCKQEATVACSSTEADYKALANAAAELQ